MGFRGRGQIDPPQRILVFKYPSRDRVNGVNLFLDDYAEKFNHEMHTELGT